LRLDYKPDEASDVRGRHTGACPRLHAGGAAPGRSMRLEKQGVKSASVVFREQLWYLRMAQWGPAVVDQ
jgi:hypothetical protein